MPRCDEKLFGLDAISKSNFLLDYNVKIYRVHVPAVLHRYLNAICLHHVTGSNS